MGYENQPDKGKPGGSCNRQICQKPAAIFKHYNGKYYCAGCAHIMNKANHGDPCWKDCELDEEVLKAYEQKLDQLVG